MTSVEGHGEFAEFRTVLCEESGSRSLQSNFSCRFIRPTGATMRNIMKFIARLSVAALILSVLSLSIANAQEAADTSPDLKPIIEQAKKSGMTVVIMSPEEDKKAAVLTEEASLAEDAYKFRARVRAIIANIPSIGPQIATTLRAASPDGSINWLWQSVLTALGGIAVGTVVAIVFQRATRKRLGHLFDPDPKTRAAKISYLLFRAMMLTISCALMFAVAIAVALVFDSGHEPSRATILILVSAYVAYWVFRSVIFFNIIAPDTPKHRMINLDDKTAEIMQKDWRNSMVVVILAFAICLWMEMLGLNLDAHKLFLVVAMGMAALIYGLLSVKHKNAFAGVILGEGDPSLKPVIRRMFAASWHILAVLYLFIAWLVSSYRLITDTSSDNMLVSAPIVAAIAALPIYCVILIVIDRFYAARQARFNERVELAAKAALKERLEEERAREKALAHEPLSESDVIANIRSSHADEDQYPVFRATIRPLLERAAGILISIVALAFVLGAWDINIGERGNPVTAFMDTILITFAAWFMYRLTALLVDERLEAEGVVEGGDPAEIEDEPSGHGTTRLGTLLPLLRNIAIGVIGVIAGMIILSNLGVDIAPLFAGAGVIGLAVGFGAQTLIRDIFSGGFFLFDDAFRKGEYIELGNVRGTVEKISLRSFQLRHHNGPLHTIPFGEIQQLTNYSRDWVIMKLPLRVTYDTDVEKVRKLVKKLGQRLLEDPDVGPMFLQPLKSQGVVQMEDSAMILRVKFMTKPGDQWVTRKVVYASIRELFEQEGIRFASREVTVRIADETGPNAVAHHKEAAAAAARGIIDQELEDAGGVEENVDDR